MTKSSKRLISRVLAFVMLVSAMFANVVYTQAEEPSGGPIKVWDFGGVAQEGELYTNVITRAFLDAFDVVGDAASGNKGKFLADGTYDFGEGLKVNTLKNDRLFYAGADGIRSYGTNADAIFAYPDGYTADGMWYANGTGGEGRRYIEIEGVKAGTEIKVYTGCSNSVDCILKFTAGSQNDGVVFSGGDSDIAKFIVAEDCTAKIWFDAAGGKPIVNRVVATPPVTVTGTVDKAGNPVSNYTINFKNDTTGDVTEVVVTDDKYTVSLTPGYSYTATMSGASGFGFTNTTRKFSVDVNEITTGKVQNMVVEPKSVYKVSGTVKGFAADYDVSKLAVIFKGNPDDMADDVAATMDGTSFSATLEPDSAYTAELTGVNDYEITEGAVFNDNKDLVQDITVAPKAIHSVKGNILGGANVTEMVLVNMEDGYEYPAAVSGSTYSVSLRDGNYEVKATAEGYHTMAHIAVAGKDVTEDVLFVSDNPTPPQVDTSVKDIYVGVEGKTNNYATMKEAVAAAKIIDPKSEADRVTIHIAPGTYREQLIIDTPYITLKPEGKGEVKLTWYYGIGYKYYSVGADGYYNAEYAADKFSRDLEPAKWAVSTYVKNTAVGFKAENITFEASFNKYITDEEIADGVIPSSSLPQRTYATDAQSKAATERATALVIEGDKAELKDCTFLGSQDTLYMGDDTHTYYKNCVIEGNTDYIFGSGNAVFDGCELRFCGYSETAMGGYITAGRSNNKAGYMGYLFRACTVTNKEGMQHAAGFFGRPWDAGSDITFFNTTLENADAITADGWTEMSGVKPTAAKFKEYGTVNADGTPVDTSKRVTGVMSDTDAAGIDAKSYLAWDPTYYVNESLPVEFSTAPYFSSDGDVLLPATGDTFTVKYSLGANDENDNSKIVYSLVKDGQETVIKSTTAVANKGILITKDMLGSFIKATVTPATIYGSTGTAKSIVTEKEITEGSGSVDTDRPSGKAVVFLAGDSTVKDYSAGAINNSGANRPEGSWGEFLKYYLDSSKYEVMDYAEGGRSTRTFIDGTKSDGSDRFMDKIKEQMVAGDYLLIQFGHNDSSESYQDRYVPVGTPDSKGSYPYTAPSADGAGDGSFKWYLQYMVDAAKAVGATPVMVTPVSRMYFDSNGNITSHHGSHDEYVIATKQVAEENGLVCLDLYTLSKELYEQAYKEDGANGSSDLAYRLFANGEKTHHSKLGGFALAGDMAEMIKASGLGLASAVQAPSKSMYITDDKGNAEFMVNNSGVFTGYGRNAEGVFDTSVPCDYWTKYINDIITEIKNGSVTPPVTTDEDKSDVIIDKKADGITFIAGVKDLNYKEAGFIFEVDGKAPVTKSTLDDGNKVYSSIAGYTEKPNGKSYVYAFTITGVPAGAQIKVTPYVVKTDGTKVLSESKTIS